MRIFIARTFQWWEVSILKICLISLGILLGLYFYNYLISFLMWWWGIFVITALYFIARFLRGE